MKSHCNARLQVTVTVTVTFTVTVTVTVTFTVTVTVTVAVTVTDRAFAPVESRKCGGVSRSDVGRKTATTTPANLPPGAVCRRSVSV
jgi:hypothetical protein